MDPVLAVDFAKGGGFVTAIALDDASWSRSRGKLWHKGEESGHTQRVRGIYLDCDGDTLVLRVEQRGGAACHTGKRSCFFRKLEAGRWVDLGEQVFDPEEVYGR
jgi:phosphoribosyl-AMP cyclohydrolase